MRARSESNDIILPDGLVFPACRPKESTCPAATSMCRPVFTARPPETSGNMSSRMHGLHRRPSAPLPTSAVFSSPAGCTSPFCACPRLLDDARGVLPSRHCKAPPGVSPIPGDAAPSSLERTCLPSSDVSAAARPTKAAPVLFLHPVRLELRPVALPPSRFSRSDKASLRRRRWTRPRRAQPSEIRTAGCTSPFCARPPFQMTHAGFHRKTTQIRPQLPKKRRRQSSAARNGACSPLRRVFRLGLSDESRVHPSPFPPLHGNACAATLPPRRPSPHSFLESPPKIMLVSAAQGFQYVYFFHE